MTAADACALVVELTREVSAARAESESWRLVALATLTYAADLQRQLDLIDERSYIVRTRTADRLDLFLDQRDVREAA